MKLLKSLLASALLITILAAGTLAFPAPPASQPDECEKNYYEYETADDIIEDLKKCGKAYTISMLTTEEYKELWTTMLDIDKKKVDDGLISATKQESDAILYRLIYDELQLDHGFIKRVERTDGSIHYKYQSKFDYYDFFGDTNTLFFSTIAE